METLPAVVLEDLNPGLMSGNKILKSYGNCTSCSYLQVLDLTIFTIFIENKDEDYQTSCKKSLKMFSN
jgi:hypothetical protein